MTRSWQGNELVDVHVTHRYATKEHAIEKWCELLNLTKDEVIGMGDSGNDLPIFEAVGMRAAVENATPEMLALADYVLPRPEEGALEHAIKELLCATR